MTLDLVVARYHERTEWTRNVPRSTRVFIYDKSGTAPEHTPAAENEGVTLDAARPHAQRTVLPLDNVGREAHTYLHHILSRWDSLAETTVFAQGHPFDHASDFHAVLRELATGQGAGSGFRWLGFIIDSDDPRGRRLFVPWSKNEDGRELRTDLFYQALFERPAPDWLRFYPGGQFVVSRERIRARDRAFYERAFMLAATFPDGAHCFERVWDAVFGVSGVDPALLDGAMCRYLKPVRTGQHGAG